MVSGEVLLACEVEPAEGARARGESGIAVTDFLRGE